MQRGYSVDTSLKAGVGSEDGAGKGRGEAEDPGSNPARGWLSGSTDLRKAQEVRERTQSWDDTQLSGLGSELDGGIFVERGDRRRTDRLEGQGVGKELIYTC